MSALTIAAIILCIILVFALAIKCEELRGCQKELRWLRKIRGTKENDNV